MKYISLFLIFTLVFLASCFEKPVNEDASSTGTVAEEDISNSEEDTADEENSASDEIEENNESEEDSDSGENLEENENINESTNNQTSVEASGSTQADDENIDEYEEELESLFNDILGEDAN